jgi:hemerythrin superfamily protein
MGHATMDRAKAAQLPEGDVIRILLEQHARIRELFDEIKGAGGVHKQHLWDELRQLLAVHETAEEMILRPVTRRVASEDVAKARNDEEAEANEVLAELEKLEPGSPDFERQFALFEQSVDQHAEKEEHEEFPQVLAECSETERENMGRMLKAAEATAPTHPHPSSAGSTTAQWVAGPFSSLADRAKDAIKDAMK